MSPAPLKAKPPPAPRRPRPGCEIRLRGVHATGTLGCFVRTGDALFAVTCEHVLAPELTPPRRGAIVEVRLARGWTELGTVARLGGITGRSLANELDVALVELRPDARVDLLHPDWGAIDPTPYRLDEISPNLHVRKIGAASGPSAGIVSGFHDTIRINYTAQRSFAGFRSLLEIEPAYSADVKIGKFAEFAASGDSGSLVVSIPFKDQKPRPVGLLVSHQGLIRRGYSILWQRVCEWSGVPLAVR